MPLEGIVKHAYQRRRQLILARIRNTCEYIAVIKRCDRWKNIKFALLIARIVELASHHIGFGIKLLIVVPKNLYERRPYFLTPLILLCHGDQQVDKRIYEFTWVERGCDNVVFALLRQSGSSDRIKNHRSVAFSRYQFTGNVFNYKRRNIFRKTV